VKGGVASAHGAANKAQQPARQKRGVAKDRPAAEGAPPGRTVAGATRGREAEPGNDVR
jgi:hypothetical protein